MSDTIEVLCQKYGFDERIKRQKDSIVAMVVCFYRAYEYYYGIPCSPPIDLIKRFIRELISISPEAVNLRMEVEKEIWKKVIDRVVEKTYKTAERELLETKAVAYIA